MARLIHSIFSGYESSRNSGVYEIVLRTHDEAGNELRSFRASSAWPLYPHAITGHKNGYVWMAGAFIGPGFNTYTASYGTAYNNQNNADKIIRLNINNHFIADVSSLHKNAPVYALFCDPTDDSLYLLGRPVDNSGNRWVSGSRSGFATLRRFNAAGTETLAIDALGETENQTYALWPCFVVASDGSIIVGYNQAVVADYTQRGIVKKYNSSGVLQWMVDTGLSGEVYSLAVDSSGNVFVGGTVWNAAAGTGYVTALGAGNIRASIVKYSSAGAYLAEHNGYYSDAAPGNRVGGTLSIANNKLYSTGYNLFKIYDLALSPLYASVVDVRHQSAVGGERIYVGLAPPSGYYVASDVKQIRAYSPDIDTALWAAQTYYNDDYPLGLIPSACNGLAVVENAETLPLALPLALKAPVTIGDAYAHCPGLALGFALKAPDILRDWAGAYTPHVFYRLWIADAAGAVELPCSSLHCRFTVGYVHLSVVVPGVSEAQADAIADKANGAIVVYRGFRLNNGIEQLDEWVRAEITAIRTDAGSERQPIPIDAEKETLANPKTRVLKGLSYRASNSGKRRARGAVDVYLRPMDTLDIGGGETFIVGELVCQVDADGAVMDVTEYLE